MSEFRQDIVSGDWVIVASNRAKRPDELVKPKPKRVSSPRKTCPFEDLAASGNWPAHMILPEGGTSSRWDIAVIPNKYPALTHAGGCAAAGRHALYETKSGAGEHELLITHDHAAPFADLSSATASKVFEILQERHRILAKDGCAAYVSSFMNWGPSAGASISHPHYQTLALPIVPPHVAHSLEGAASYFKAHKRCVRCDIIKTELAEKKRIVGRNAHAVAFVPFASKHPFEVAILPRRHDVSFVGASKQTLGGMAHLLQEVLRMMKRRLGDPDLNFFIHSAPTNARKYPFHHWHIEVVPVNVVSPPGGFEAATSIDINVIDPDAAAKILRK